MPHQDDVVVKRPVINRRRILQGVGAASAAMFLFAAAACGDDDEANGRAANGESPTSIGLAVIPLGNSVWPHELAEAKGWFLEEDVSPREFVRTFDQIEALLSGEVDVVSQGPEELIAANTRGSDLVMIGVQNYRPVQFMVADPSIETLQDLEGRRVGIFDRASTDFAIAFRLLEDAGVDMETVEFVRAGGSSDRYSALEAGQVDAAPLDPAISHLFTDGSKRILASPDDFGEWPWVVYAAERRWLEENEDAVVGLLRALDRSMEFINDPSNDDELLAEMDGVSETPVEEFESALSLLREYEVTPYDGLAPESSQFQPVVDFLRDSGQIDGDVDVDSMIDPRYWNQAND